MAEIDDELGSQPARSRPTSAAHKLSNSHPYQDPFSHRPGSAPGTLRASPRSLQPSRPSTANRANPSRPSTAASFKPGIPSRVPASAARREVQRLRQEALQISSRLTSNTSFLHQPLTTDDAPNTQPETDAAQRHKLQTWALVSNSHVDPGLTYSAARAAAQETLARLHAASSSTLPDPATHSQSPPLQRQQQQHGPAAGAQQRPGSAASTGGGSSPGRRRPRASWRTTEQVRLLTTACCLLSNMSPTHILLTQAEPQPQ